MGNISPFIATVVTALNYAINNNRWGETKFNYAGGNMVHHSDEAGRPFTDDIDLPFIAFFPPKEEFCNTVCKGERIVLFETAEEFGWLVNYALKSPTNDPARPQYNVELNPGWIKDLKIANPQSPYDYESYEIQGPG